MITATPPTISPIFAQSSNVIAVSCKFRRFGHGRSRFETITGFFARALYTEHAGDWLLLADVELHPMLTH
jgi:hypothetical protein